MKNKKKMTIVVINDFDYIQGGASKVALDTAEMLYNKGFNVIFFSSVHKPNNYGFKQISLNQTECFNDGIFGAFRGLYNFKAEKELRKLLKSLDKNNTIIHIHGWTKALSSSIFKAINKEKFKSVLTLHDYFTVCPNGGFFNYKKCEICKKKAMSFDCIKTNCDSRNYLFKIYRIIRQYIQNRNIKYVKYVIPVSKFCYNIIKDNYNNDVIYNVIDNPINYLSCNRVKAENNDIYLYVGRVSKEKGVSIFCKAISQLGLNGVVIGDGDELIKLKNKYKNINFIGWKEQKDILDYYSKTRALIFPSLWYETAGLTALEASYLGIPVIVSDSSASTAYIRNEKEGLHFKTGSCKDLKAKILLLQDNSMIKKYSETAYKNSVSKPYSVDNHYNKLTDYYNEILKK